MQSKKVQTALEKLAATLSKIKTSNPELKKLIRKFVRGINDGSFFGDDTYEMLTARYEENARTTRTAERSDKLASLKLLEYGIAGNEFPSGSLSNMKSEGRNFVVFGDDLIEIKKTYYRSDDDYNNNNESSDVNEKTGDRQMNKNSSKHISGKTFESYMPKQAITIGK